MPWKAFMQSSALTNPGNQLANELFMQRENASCSLNIAQKWGIRSLNYFVAIWRPIARSYKKSRRMLIQATLQLLANPAF